MAKIKNYTLQVGESADIGGFFSSTGLTYAGMPNGETYSLGLHQDGGGHQGYGINLFFPITQRRFVIENKKLIVRGITPEEILLQYIKE